MAGKTHVEDCLLQDKNNVREDMMAAGLSPSLQNKLTKRPTKWSGHAKIIDPPKNFYIRKTFYPRG